MPKDLIDILSDHEKDLRRLRATLARFSSGPTGFLPLAGGTMIGDIDLGGNDLLNPGDIPGYVTDSELSAVEAALLADLAAVEADLADYLPLAGGTMLGDINYGGFSALGLNEIQIDDGSAADPGFTFTNDDNTGLFLASSDNIGVSLGGNHRYQFSDNYFGGTVSGSAQVKAAASTTGAPGYTFSGDSDTGLHSNAANTVHLITGGTTAAAFTSAATSFQTGTTGSAANLNQASSGSAVNRFTSALRYKSDLSDADHLADIELKPQRFYRADDDRYMYGFIADWIANQDELLGAFHNGEIDGFDLIGLMAVLAAKVNRLERQQEEAQAIISMNQEARN